MERELIARLRYYKGDDWYAIEIYDEDDGEWGLNCACPCRKYLDFPNEEPAGVNYTMLTELVKMCEMGYRIHMSTTDEAFTTPTRGVK